MRARKEATRAADLAVADFVVQQHPLAAEYDYFVCRSCKLTWFLPKDATRRTKEALDILREHAVSHSRNAP
jgi:hypothetical protein